MLSEIEKKLLTVINKDELVELTRNLIRIDSVIRPETGNTEAGVVKFISNWIKRELDMEPEINEVLPGRENIILKIDSKLPGKTLMLEGHTDVVSEGDRSLWKHDPFGAEIDNKGYIHGRGAADLKGGLSVHLFTIKLFKLLKDRGASFKGNLIFSAVVHEEAAEMFGMEYLFKQTFPDKKLGCDLVLLCEPTGLNVVLGQRGKVEIVVKTKGKTAHSSIPQAGINALEKMMPVLDHVFNKLCKSISSHPLLGESSVTITNLICRPGALSIIPDECEISIDRRYMPDERVEELLEEFEFLFEEIKKNDPQFEATVCVRKLVERSYTGYEKEVQKYHPPWITDEEHPLVQKTLLALKKIGQHPEIKYWKFGTDGSMTSALMGIPTIGYSGTEERYAHTPDEMVNMEMMMQSLEGYFSIISELLELEPDQF